MSCDVTDVVVRIIKTGALDDYCDMTREQMIAHDPRQLSGCFVFDGLLKLVLSSCMDDTDAQTIKKLHSYLEGIK